MIRCAIKRTVWRPQNPTRVFGSTHTHAANFSKLTGGTIKKNSDLANAKRSGSAMPGRQAAQADTHETREAAVHVKPDTVASMQDSWHMNLTGEDWLNGPRSLEWYTGKPPVYGVCAGVNKEGVIRSLPVPNLDKVTRQGTQDYFDNTWTLLDTMFAGLNGEETFYRPPVHGLRHPQIFYYGHSSCLYVNKLRVAGLLDAPVDTFLESVLETGVDEMLWDDMHRFDDPWPTVAQVHEYRKKVYPLICKIIAEHPDLEDNNGKSPVKITMDSPLWGLFMGFEHERIHIETSSVLFREMPQHLLQVPTGWPAVFPPAPILSHKPLEGLDYPKNKMLPVKGTKVVLGKPKDQPVFGWDVEYGEREVDVPDFEASKFMVTNGEFYEFVVDGGYHTDRYWCENGNNWRRFRNMKWPFFWVLDGPSGSHQFKLRTIFETIDMQWSHPAEVNYYESQAFGEWKAEREGKDPHFFRLITEAEHHLIRDSKSANNARAKNDASSDRVMVASGHTYATPGVEGNANLNLAYSSCSPVDLMEPSETGHHDAMGNAWEWTEDHFNPLQGFKPHPFYTDFSEPCFDGQHNMIMGGSFISTGIEASTFARFSFRPHFLQHSGFRLVSSNTPPPATKIGSSGAANSEGDDLYETDELVNQYLGLHYSLASGKSEGVDSILSHEHAPIHALRFPQRMAELLHTLKPTHTNGRALDVGCAVGGTSFELATKYSQVMGVDFSNAFINMAKRMQKAETETSFKLSTEGLLVKEILAKHEPHIDQAVRDRVTFTQGDACALSPESLGGKFDGIVVANLICRIPEPLKCLDGLAACTNPGGVVLLCTPFSWLEQYTPKQNWLGGFHCPETGEPKYSKDRLRTEMEARGFTKIHDEQIAALIREHQRKYQYIISEATGWRRN